MLNKGRYHTKKRQGIRELNRRVAINLHIST